MACAVLQIAVNWGQKWGSRAGLISKYGSILYSESTKEYSVGFLLRASLFYNKGPHKMDFVGYNILKICLKFLTKQIQLD